MDVYMTVVLGTGPEPGPLETALAGAFPDRTPFFARMDPRTGLLSNLPPRDSRVLVQPLLLLPGITYGRLRAQLEGRFSALRVAAPLLGSDGDGKVLAHALERVLEPPALLIAHGAEDGLYRPLALALKPGYTLVSGTPHLPEGLPPAVTLAPLLLTRGRHRKKDPACWQGFLEAAGYHAEARDLYLTELPEVRAMFEDHSRQALSEEVNL